MIVDGGEVVLVVPPQILDDGEQIRLCIAQCIPTVDAEESVYIQAGYTGENRFDIRTNSGNSVYSTQLRSRTVYPMTASSNEGGFIVNPRYLCHNGTILTRATPPADNGGDTPAPASDKAVKG